MLGRPAEFLSLMSSILFFSFSIHARGLLAQRNQTDKKDKRIRFSLRLDLSDRSSTQFLTLGRYSLFVARKLIHVPKQQRERLFLFFPFSIQSEGPPCRQVVGRRHLFMHSSHAEECLSFCLVVLSAVMTENSEPIKGSGSSVFFPWLKGPSEFIFLD